MKRFAPCLLLALIALVGCGGEEETAGLASFRGLNLATGAGTVRFAADTGNIGDAVVGNATSYVSVQAGSQDVYATRLDTGSSIGRSVSGEENTRTTLALLGKVGDAAFPLSLRVYPDATTNPEEGQTTVRLLHGSTRTTSAVDVYVTAQDTNLATVEPVVAGMAYGFMSDYHTVAVGEANLRVRITAAGTKTPVLAEITGFAPGSTTTRTIVLSDQGSGVRASVLSN